MIPENFGAFILLTTLASIAPSPNAMFVMSQAALRGPAAGIRAGLGIELVNIIYLALTMLGLASVIAASVMVFEVLKWVGAAYLLGLGAFVFWRSFRKDRPQDDQTPHLKAHHGAFRDGIFVALGNPKTIIYFVVLLPPFIDPSRDVLGQTLVIGGAGMVIDLACQSLYCLLGGTLSRLLGHPKLRQWFERGLGVAFVILATVVAFYRRAT
jgi:threonine/homoserine/homoserine lactone efflux protein